MTDKADEPPSYDSLNLKTLSNGIRQTTVYDDPSPIYTAKEGEAVDEEIPPPPPPVQPTINARAVPTTRPRTANRQTRVRKRGTPGFSGGLFVVVIIIVIISVNVFNNRDDVSSKLLRIDYEFSVF